MEAWWSMEMAPGVNPRPGRVPEQELLTPETEFRMAAEHRGVFAIMTILARVYASGALSSPKGSSGSVTEGPHHRRAQSPLGRAQLWRGGYGPPQHLPFWLRESSGEISSTQKDSSNSENFGFFGLSAINRHNKQELALWHLVNRLVPENV